MTIVRYLFSGFSLIDNSLGYALTAVSLVALNTSVSIPFGAALAAVVHAQSQAANLSASVPKFAVSTIKRTKSGEDRFGFNFTPEGISMVGLPVQTLLREAFDIEDDRILGAPSWVKSERFDIQAKVDEGDAPKLAKMNANQRLSMLRQLLEDRFGLKYHHEVRDVPAYTLVVAKGGSKLKPDDGSAQPVLRMMGPGHFEAQRTPVEDLTHVLSQQVGHTVVDKTGLKGNYDFALQWTPDNAPAPNTVASGPSFFTAIEEQLGLKLQSQKRPVDVIVIDHIGAPTPN